MKASFTLSLLAPIALAAPSWPNAVEAQPAETYDYWQFNREIVWRGMQALFLCNGLFTSNRSLEQVFEQELAFIPDPVGTASGGDYVVDWDRRAVAVGAHDGAPPIRAAFREGIGCVSMAPDQTFEDINSLPLIDMHPLAGDPNTVPWPNGDLVEPASLPSDIHAAKLAAASDWAFERDSDEQVTLSLLIVHDGDIIHERYAPGVDMTTRTRTWSTAKSIAATLIGMLVDDGRMSLDGPLEIGWLPDVASAEHDPRSGITLRHVLNMSSGLYPIDNDSLEYATGSGMSYWVGGGSVRQLRHGAMIRSPGTYWDYENYDTLRAVYAMKRALGDEQTYHEFPRRALFDKIGMRSTLVGMDRFGDFILSSQIYTNARDLARFGLLYLNNGVWDGERLISEDWIEFVRTPAPALAELGNDYGGQFWLVPDDRKDEVPADAYATVGNRGQYTLIVPSHDLVIVRRGLDYGEQGFDRWELLRVVLEAFDEPSS
jgi:CubicO group peptidase (beta-lactamase class C family)